MEDDMRGFDWLDRVRKRVSDPVVLVGIRGFHKAVNKRGVYDDALIWLNTATGFIATYNANCDPSSYRKGMGFGSKKGMASLKDGVWCYRIGKHGYNTGKPYPAFVQAEKVQVLRDGIEGPYDDYGYFGINIHRGGYNTTSSLGCQTVPPNTWDDFFKTGQKLLKDAGQDKFYYVLNPYSLQK
jgi:lysozyme